MEQWEKYPVDLLLEIADSAVLPTTYQDTWVTCDAKDSWKVVIHYDCGDLDYIDEFIAPDGEVIDFWEWPGSRTYDPEHPSCRLSKWRGVRRPEKEEAPNPWDALKSMTTADIVERTLALNAAMENAPGNAFVRFATANWDRYGAAADLAILLKRALSTGAISWEQAEAACGGESIVVYDLMHGRVDGFDVERIGEMAAAVEKAWAGSVINDVYIDEQRTRYYPLSAEAHFLLQRRLEIAQEALKPFAKHADWLDETASWRAKRRTSLVANDAVRNARQVLLDQKVWDLPEASA